MPLYPILLIAVILAHDQMAAQRPPDAAAAWWAIGPVIGAVALAWAGTWWARRRLERTASPSMIVAAERMARAARALIVANHAVCVLMLGWVQWVRSLVGDLILLDEMVMIGPAVLGLVATWWVLYPVEARARQAILMRNLDEGRPVHPVPSRGAYVLLQTRLHLLFMLVPLLLIAGAHETVVWTDKHWQTLQGLPDWARQLTLLSTTLIVFLIAPLLARLVLDVQPLPAGELRDELQGVCDAHRVKVRQILIWNTSGLMMNAAVMGIIAPLRYVLITDALLETMTLEQVRGVMAHEVGHIRRRHMPWLMAGLVAAVGMGWVVSIPPALIIPEPSTQFAAHTIDVSLGSLQIVTALVIFGWISRRFERQADTFAVQHLSRGQPLVTMEAAEAMRQALGTIAALNSIPFRRRSWRHGSIFWRRAYLATLVDRPAQGLPIDRLVVGVKFAIAAGVIFLIVASIVLST